MTNSRLSFDHVGHMERSLVFEASTFYRLTSTHGAFFGVLILHSYLDTVGFGG
jgi:hypothetical protein